MTVTRAARGDAPAARARGGGREPEELVGRILDTVSEILTRELGMEPGNAFVRYEESRPSAQVG